METPQKTVVIGAGPVGSLAALYAAQRGHQVEVYELRPDLRKQGIIPLNFTKSINLAVSERGIKAMQFAGHPTLLETVMDSTIPMRGRMIHGQSAAGALYEYSQDYDVKGRVIYAIDRSGLNSRLLDVLDSMPNVRLFFNHKLTGADFRTCRAWLEARDQTESSNGRPKEIEIRFDLMIGADGAHSAVRYHIMKFSRMDYRQEYVDTLWCEFKVEPKPSMPNDPSANFQISSKHLHIWPGKHFMFIAIPSKDGSFTCTLFLPSKQFADLEADPSALPTFFDEHFPGVSGLIPREMSSLSPRLIRRHHRRRCPRHGPFLWARDERWDGGCQRFQALKEYSEIFPSQLQQRTLFRDCSTKSASSARLKPIAPAITPIEFTRPVMDLLRCSKLFRPQLFSLSLERLTLSSPLSSVASRASSTHAISKPTLANIEKRWEGMPLQEQADLWMALRDRMKGDWNELTIQEKKAAYWIAFGPHGPRAVDPPGTNASVAWGVAKGLAVSLVLFAIIRSFAKPEPHTMTREYQEAANEMLKRQKADPITGISSEGYTGRGQIQSPPKGH
ncbi:hypothetical protein XA68_18163 [Ophiocordyceps unilateralis]|uniref:Cytochrome c oxidase polypeptide V n=1 Tax=Ophiocordyceps unilateralis TaxID=268505 RepID=A0A2A9P2U5_OPHUN|nr:hypothetical protein XA68_18163 [Ophiocordyceps unilateralis]